MPPTPTSSLRIGVLGLGAIAQTAHLPVLSKMRGVQLAALCDNDAAKARSLAQRFGVRDICTDVEELLDCLEANAVAEREVHTFGNDTFAVRWR